MGRRNRQFSKENTRKKKIKNIVTIVNEPFDLNKEFKKLYEKEYTIESMSKLLGISLRETRELYSNYSKKYTY